MSFCLHACLFVCLFLYSFACLCIYFGIYVLIYSKMKWLFISLLSAQHLSHALLLRSYAFAAITVNDQVEAFGEAVDGGERPGLHSMF